MGLFSHQRVFVSSLVYKGREKLIKILQKYDAELIEEHQISHETFYVIDQFIGPKFEELQKKTHIIGSQCIFDSIDINEPLPLASNPIFSRTLENISICCTGSQKSNVSTLVRYMNGIYHKELCNSQITDFLIATEVLSQKYQYAVQKNIPILHPSWIDACWESRSVVDTVNYILPPFSGCIISVTGLGTGMRNMIQQLVTIYGAQFSPNLNKRCTHLIANAPTGVKYKYAESWRIPVVTMEWIFTSLKINACAPTKNFLVSNPILPSLNDETIFPEEAEPNLEIEETSLKDLKQDLDHSLHLIDNIVEKSLTVENVCDFLVIADTSRSSFLRETCINIILEHYEAVQNTDGFNQLSEHIRKELDLAFSSDSKKRKYSELFESRNEP